MTTLSSTCYNDAYTYVPLENVTEFPVKLTSEQIWDKIVAAVGEDSAYRRLTDWTGLKPNICSSPNEPKFVVDTQGGYSSTYGSFVGYAWGEEVDDGGPVCLWGDSEAPDAEFSTVGESRHDVLFAVCKGGKSGDSFILHVVYDEYRFGLAEALGVSFEDLLINN